ncbi:MAG: putative zinc-binding metallopeptidase [Pseudomonadota bacterium]
MRLFSCPNCGALVSFHNTQCLTCGQTLVFDDGAQAFILGLTPCRNRAEIDCNWASTAGEGGLCRSCDMTEVVPETFHGDNRALWGETELSKRRALAMLARWGWFGPSDPGPAPSFHLLSEETSAGPRDVVMAHASGVITINVMEADVVERVERRETLGEKLRTMVGHVRHETAHFLFERLAAGPEFLEAFRALMGDERADYSAALQRYYAEGPEDGWEGRFITRYASMHPHEDWAETVTHLLHLTDIIDGAVACRWPVPDDADLAYDPYAETDAEEIIRRGVYYGMAVNHINQSVGVGDLYPFVLTDAVREKLAFAHRWLSRGGAPR